MVDTALSMADGSLVATIEAGDSLRSNIILSLLVRRGTLCFAPWFGSRLHEIRTVNSDTVALATDYCKESLAWLLKLGRLSSVDVRAEADPADATRLNIAGTAVRANEETVPFNTFVRVA